MKSIKLRSRSHSRSASYAVFGSHENKTNSKKQAEHRIPKLKKPQKCGFKILKSIKLRSRSHSRSASNADFGSHENKTNSKKQAEHRIPKLKKPQKMWL